MNEEIETEEDQFEPRPERIKLYSAAHALEQARALLERNGQENTK